eukprot:TRINITY_DN44988_c0_g1_i1.p1 TRINITY_DN44988_c0_g1~~TRINITY_DN44988_c0_g1_i1.p1  ORF type:complete len:470 (+),score=73.57 TRINITY_DN44988_c0_g1_i1:231-1640(+)
MTPRVINIAVSVVLLSLSAFGSREDHPKRPQRFHLYPTDTVGNLVVGWATEKMPSTESFCVVSPASPPTSAQVQRATANFTAQFPATSEAWSSSGYDAVSHVTIFTGLVHMAWYSYVCGSRSHQSDPTTFQYLSNDAVSVKTPASGLAAKVTTAVEDAFTWAVYGDFDLTGDASLAQLTSDASAQRIHGILHIGDFAYDLHSDGGAVGDDFEAAVEPVYGTIPTAVIPGNHEKSHNFTHYRNRFRAATRISSTNPLETPLWWSFDHGAVHFVGFSTELFAYDPDPAQTANMLAFLLKDVSAANARRQGPAGMRRPWVVAVAHKASWMEDTDYSVLGPMLEGLGVDLLIAGHKHMYARQWPFDPSNVSATVQRFADPAAYVNPRHLVQVVVGSPGCKNGISDHPQTPASVTEVRAYGYSRLRANATALTMEWVEVAADSLRNGRLPRVLDKFTITQQRHGPRASGSLRRE